MNRAILEIWNFSRFFDVFLMKSRFLAVPRCDRRAGAVRKQADEKLTFQEETGAKAGLGSLMGYARFTQAFDVVVSIFVVLEGVHPGHLFDAEFRVQLR